MKVGCKDRLPMIDAYDHYFGEGTGEAFFYLDLLPDAVIESAVSE